MNIERKKYITPITYCNEMEAGNMMAASVVSEDLGLIYKGDASIYDITEADANKNFKWDNLW
ncbi:MAG: hypothetical protein IIU60_02160 [Paraprevotella sp.]|nr:hypothetical protein [Paraprevotella sp.]